MTKFFICVNGLAVPVVNPRLDFRVGGMVGSETIEKIFTENDSMLQKEYD